MENLTDEQKQAFDKINALVKDFDLLVAIENNVVIPIPPKPKG